MRALWSLRFTVLVALSSLVALSGPAQASDAQAIGTFAWQVEPFCNIVRFTVTSDGPVFRLTGTDDQCGAGAAPAAGVATPNADGTFTLAFYLITSQGLASHTTATVVPGSFNGSWKDHDGNTGTFRFNPANPAPGAPRPLPAERQRRIAGTCASGEYVQSVNQDGSVNCAAASGSEGGDITAVGAGTGLTGGGGTGDVTLSVAAGGIGSLQIADGSIAAADVNTNEIQRRVQGTCAVGLLLVTIAAPGTVLCDDGAVGEGNIALGLGALSNNTFGIGIDNSAVGRDTLGANTTGHSNTAVGTNALRANTTAFWNTAVGVQALLNNTTGRINTAVGHQALLNNTTGSHNQAVGSNALRDNTEGWNNIAVGDETLLNNTTGSNNIAIGRGAGFQISTGHLKIMIGNNLGGEQSETIRLGQIQTRAFIAGIRGRTTGSANAVNVLIDSAGQLGTISSSRHNKVDISDMGQASGGLLRLRPVTFRYIQPYADGSRPFDYGLIAEEVAEVYPDLVVRDESGAIETVQYHKLTPMLLNELQRQQRELDAQRAAIEGLQAWIRILEGRLERRDSPRE